MKDFLQYLLSKSFWKNVGMALVLLLMAFLILKLYIRIYTHHGKAMAVPDFTGKTVEEIEETLKEKKLRYEVFDSLYTEEMQPGVVIDQLPEPGKLVKKNRKIFLTLNAQGPETVVVPDLIGVTLREAREKLNSYGLAIGEQEYRYHLTKNVVLEQKLNGEPLAPGDTIVKGTAIDIVLGKGLGNETSVVPNLIGLTVEEARTKASDYMFSLGSAVADLSFDPETDTTIPFVFRQRPVHNENVRAQLGSPIDVYITIDSTKLPQVESADSSFVWSDLND